MSLFNRGDNRQFGLICFCTFQLYLLIVYIFYLKGYPIKEFLYCLPVIAFEMLIHYILFWKPDEDSEGCYYCFNITTVVIMVGIFFGVYFGLFNLTLQYHLQDAQDCKIIGRYNTKVEYVQVTESYSALYINFTLDGEEYLGYGCLSSLHNAYPPKMFFDPIPYNFYYKGLSQCDENYQCFFEYTFNEVKLPSWMCLPFDTDFEHLLNLNKCYVNFFNNGSNDKQDPAYENARNRNEINKLQSFALTTFSKVTVPYDQYIWLIMMTFCPILPAISIIFFEFTRYLESTLKNLNSELKDEFDDSG